MPQQSRLDESNFYSSSGYASLPESMKLEVIKQVLDIRKFEIELYWKRAGHFWIFISLAFSAYGAAYAKMTESVAREAYQDLLVVVSCVGVVVSFAWFLANKGSKYWQENWEGHLDLIEDGVFGPLYKTLFKEKSCCNFKDYMLNSAMYSVTKIYQAVSFFVLVLWIFLLFVALRFPPCDLAGVWQVVFIVCSLICCLVLGCWCKTGREPRTLRIFRRYSVPE